MTWPHPASHSGVAAVLVGADGMLGRAMAIEIARRQWHIFAPTRDELDLSRPETISRFLARVREDFGRPPTFIINCAAWTDVDGAESHEAEARAINADGVGRLATACAMDTTLLTFSTDYIFDGHGQRPYTTDQPRAPLNAYGRTKAAGEEILESMPRHQWLNIRTSWLYAPWGKNFVLTMRRLLSERPEVRVVNDQRGRPTSCEHLARMSLTLLDHQARGHWHICDGGECTWYEFTLEIKRLLNARARVMPCTSAEYPRPAARPAYSVLDLEATEAVLGPMRDWQSNLAEVMAQIGIG